MTASPEDIPPVPETGPSPEDLGKHLLEIYQSVRDSDKLNYDHVLKRLAPLLGKKFEFTPLWPDHQSITRDVWGYQFHPVVARGRLKSPPEHGSLLSGHLILGNWMFWRDDIHMVDEQAQPLVSVRYLPHWW